MITQGDWKVEQNKDNNQYEYDIFVKGVDEIARVYAGKQASDNATLIAAAPLLLAACEAQHEAIDHLFARLAKENSLFMPSESGQPWEALKQGNAAIEAVKGVK